VVSGEVTYLDNVFKEFKPETGTEVAVARSHNEVQFLLLDVEELDAVEFLEG